MNELLPALHLATFDTLTIPDFKIISNTASAFKAESPALLQGFRF